MFKSTEKNEMNRTLLISSFVAWVVVLYVLFALTSASNAESRSFFQLFNNVEAVHALSWFNPINVLKHMTSSSFLISIGVSMIFALMLTAFYLDGRRRKHDMDGIEHGSAKWLIDVSNHGKKSGGKYKETPRAKEYKKNMMSEKYTDNIMFDNTYGISMDTRKTLRNLHTLVIGGSGAGKTRFFVKPNILQMNSSYIITDPSGELFRDMGQMLKDNHYDVRVFNTFDPNLSMQYNPLSYIRSDSDVTDLVTTLIKNTGEASGDNKYFDDATKLLLSAIILFLIHYCPKSEHDFAHVMQLVVAADVPEGQKVPQSDLDKIFEQVEVVDPYGLALKMYKSFKSTSGKSLKSVLSSTATRLTVFNYAEIERLTCADTISLMTIGDEKTALFIITPPIDNGFNFLVAMMYSQLFSKLYYHTTFECRYLLTDNNYIARPFKSKDEADHVRNLLIKQCENKDQNLVSYTYDEMIEKYEMIEVETGDVLMREIREETKVRFEENPAQFVVKQNTKEEAGSPFHIRMLMDEFANINEIPGFSEVLATVRKYNMSVAIILQSLSQLKKRYEKDYDPIIGNCDTFVFLGANSLETTKHVSEALGNMTITTEGHGQSMGKSRGSSRNYSQQKRELMTANELGKLPNDEQVVMVRAIDPFRLKKFKLEGHPNFKLSADGDGQRLIIHDWFNLEKKIRALEEKRGVEIKREKQDDINQRAQQPVDGWLNKQFTGNGKHDTNRNEKEDDFFF
jgi:type IV secretory pathway TraG/TraD family ATPase VirD4